MWNPSKHRRNSHFDSSHSAGDFSGDSSSLPFCPADSLASVAGCTVRNVPFFDSQRQSSSRSSPERQSSRELIPRSHAIARVSASNLCLEPVLSQNSFSRREISKQVPSGSCTFIALRAVHMGSKAFFLFLGVQTESRDWAFFFILDGPAFSLPFLLHR
jgi:hypothetical protein